MIAGWLSGPGFRQCFGGGIVGLAFALPMLAGLGLLAAPALLTNGQLGQAFGQIPMAFWGGMLGLLGWYTLLGWLTGLLAVRRLLRQLA